MEHFSHAMAFASPMHLEGARQRSALQTVIAVLPYLWPKRQLEMRVRLVVALGCLVLGRLANVYSPIVLKDLIDSLEGFTGATPNPLVFELALLYGGVILLPGLLTEVRAALFTPVAEFAQRTIGLRAFRHLHELGMRFHLDRQTGGLSRAIERGTRALQQITGLFVFNIAPTLFEIALVCGYLAWGYDAKYVLVILAAVAAYIAFTLVFTEWRTRFRREMVAQESRATSIGVDSLLNFETVKYFGAADYEAERYNDSLLRYMHAAVRSQTTLGALNVGQLLVRVVCQLAILVLAINDYSDGTLTLGEVVMLNTFMLQLFIPLGFLGSSYRMIRQSLVDMEYLFQLLDIPPEIADQAHAKRLNPSQGTVTFDNVSFGYRSDQTVLRDVSFKVPAGHTTAIVGVSGAGKSTIARLLYRFYDVDDGAISIDDQRIETVTQQSLRAAIGIVPQDTVLFNDTIAYNIRYGRPEASDAEVAAAAKAARIDTFIESLPEGYQARVGERGLKLSGGEKQRVAIARTLLKDPAILVLDEATSALDMKTEKQIQEALWSATRNRTTLIIAHRLATIVDADEILVLDGGQIIERGNHQALLAQGGQYATMWQRQQQTAEEIAKIQEQFTAQERAAINTELERGGD